MRNITGLRKNLVLFGHLRNNKIRKLPLRVSWGLRDTFKNEKLTKANGKYIINTFMPPFPSTAFNRLIDNTVSVYNGNLSPYSAYLAITNKCEFRCWHCSKAHRRGRELSTQQWIDIVKKLQDMGVCVIGFTGGEPLLRGDLESILGAIDQRATTILFTTGDGLTDQRVKLLKKQGLSYVAVSLDDYERKEHNRLRGVERAFDVAVAAIEKFVNSGFYTAVQLTVRKDFIAIDDIERYLEFVGSLGVHEIRIIEPMPTGHLIEKEELFLTQKERDMLKKYHVTFNKNRKLPKIASFAYLEDGNLYGCGAGIQHIYIDAYGNLSPCDFTPLSFGNVVAEGFDYAFQKLRDNFQHPRGKCFILENMDIVRSSFDGNLPLTSQKSTEVCKKCSQGDLPKFYRMLGWK